MDLITIPKAMAPSSNNNVKIVNNLSGTQTDETTAIVEDEKEADNTQPTAQEPTRDTTAPLTFSQVVPVLVQKFSLPVPSGAIKFNNIPETSPVYNAFKA